MTGPRGDTGFEVEPRRLDDSAPGRRRSRLPLLAALAAATLVVTVAWIGPRLTSRPSLDLSFLPTPTPTTTPSPTRFRLASPSATPLPPITFGEGPRVTGRVAIVTDVLRSVDVGTGVVAGDFSILMGRDAVFRAPEGDGWSCVCIRDVPSVDHGRVRITLNRFGEDAQSLPRSDGVLMTVDTAPPDPNGQPAFQGDVVLAPDRRTAVLATAVLDRAVLTISLSTVDVVRATITSTRVVGTLSRADLAPVGPSAPPTVGPSAGSVPEPSQAGSQFYFDGPHLRASPDGRSVAVWATLQRAEADAIAATTTAGWMARIDPGDDSIAESRPAPALAGLPTYCGGVGFATNDRLMWFCPQFPADPVNQQISSWSVASIDLDGRKIAAVDIPATPDTYYADPLFDTANGDLYGWDPLALRILRVDAQTLAHVEQTFDSRAAPGGPGLAPGGGANPARWSGADSSVNLFHPIAGAADGSRIFALGLAQPSDLIGRRSQEALGVFVLDRATLALVGRWAPATNYVAITPVLGGALVAAAGNPGTDVQGVESSWDASLTFHDATSGRIVLRLGALGQGNPPIVVP